MIGYSGQYLDNKPFRIKVRTGEDISNAVHDAVAGEIFLVTGAIPALYVAKSTSSETEYGIYKLEDLTEASSKTSLYTGDNSVVNNTQLTTPISLAAEFTISLWFKLRTDLPSSAKLTFFNSASTNCLYFRRSDTYGNDVNLRTSGFEIQGNASNAGGGTNQSFDPFTGEWTHLSIIRNSANTISFYYNGDPTPTDTFANCPGTLNIAGLLQDSNGLNFFNQSYTSEFAIWNSDQTSLVADIAGEGMVDLSPFNPDYYWNMGDFDPSTLQIVPKIGGVTHNIDFVAVDQNQSVNFAPQGPSELVNPGPNI